MSAVILLSLKLAVACSTPSMAATASYAAKQEALQSSPAAGITMRSSFGQLLEGHAQILFTVLRKKAR